MESAKFLREAVFTEHLRWLLLEFTCAFTALSLEVKVHFATYANDGLIPGMIYYESISIDVSRKVYVILCNLWICIKNVASSSSRYL